MILLPSALRLATFFQTNWIGLPGLLVAGAHQRPGDILGGEGRAIMPVTVADGHVDRLRSSLQPHSVSRPEERKVRLLRDELVEDQAVKTLDGQVHRRGSSDLPGR